jgi:hypothetical protein
LHTKRVLPRRKGLFSFGKELTFKTENITTTDLSDATIIYMASTCFSPELMQQLLERFREIKANGLRIITLQKLPPSDDFSIAKQYTLPMTWSETTPVYVYKAR